MKLATSIVSGLLLVFGSSSAVYAFSNIVANNQRAIWPGNPANVVYQINPNFNGAPAGTAAQQLAVLQAAAAPWNASGRINLQFGGQTNLLTTTNAQGQPDGVNAIFALNMASGNALATTFTWTLGADIIEFDTIFWGLGTNFAIPAQLGPGNFDMQSIMLHEFGHGLGLGHTTGLHFADSQWARWQTHKDMHVLVGNFGGDEHDDVMKIDVPVNTSGYSNLGLWVGLSDGQGQFNTTQWARWDSHKSMHVLKGNFNGDDYDDVMKIDVPVNTSGYSNLGLWVGLSDGQGQFNTTQWARWDSHKDMHVLVGDFDGDGNDDLAKIDVPVNTSGYSNLGVWVGLSDGQGQFNSSRWARWDSHKDMHVLVGDFDGDGNDDLLKIDVPVNTSGYSNLGVWVGLSDGQGQFNSSRWAQWDSHKDMHVLVGKFNNDPYDDIMKIDVPVNTSGYSNLGVWVGLSDGQGSFTTTQWARWDSHKNMHVLVGDFNASGLADLMKIDTPVNTSGYSRLGLWVGQSLGNGFFSTGDGDTAGLGDGQMGADTDMWACWDSHPDMFVLAGDFGGDSATDVLKIDVPPSGSGYSSLGLWVGLSEQNPAPVMWPTIGLNTAIRALSRDEILALGCYYR